ncbi:MAG TPA: KpsF/GutQ family sugar-phosphate isomerase [Rhodospirillaceae bacterium]|nr:KpsF/GutQ family sugar-phosphate isomerase [Rhodospirillaceae bacterium]
MTDIDCAKNVLQVEIEGLKALEASLDERFTQAIEAIAKMKENKGGRLIIAGIGKSGHIARKIAATMASTGTPAYFVHPGEASHGDLGMVTSLDVVLMLSNSGENQELSDLIHYTRRYGITLIAMTSNPESTLARHSDIILQLPKSPEACPNGLAPTTSTTMMIALGDAVAEALLDRMKLTPEQFRAFHPGGKLGQQLQSVADLMIAYDDMAIVAPGTSMDQVILALSEKNQGCVIVAEGADKLHGIITDGDLKRHMAADLLARKVDDVMTVDPKSIAPTKLAAEALNVMTKTAGSYITSLLVRGDDGRVLGLIRLQDCLQSGVS